MNLKLSIPDFLKITWKKVIVSILCPVTAISLLLFVFMFEEVLGLGRNIIINTIYEFANYFYLFILQQTLF